MSLQVTSPAFGEGDEIPAKYTADGENVSPALYWTAPPEGTQTYAVTCEDPDAPSGTFSHWVMYNVPRAAHYLPEDVPHEGHTPEAIDQGLNDFGDVGYDGPAPPEGHGRHRYIFTVYALDDRLSIKPNATRQDLLDAMNGHVLAKGSLMGMYGR